MQKIDPPLATVPHRAGFVAVIGKPNVGKSTIVNAFVGAPVAIVSPKPTFATEFLQGRALSLEQAVALALEDADEQFTTRK